VVAEPKKVNVLSNALTSAPAMGVPFG